MRYIGGLFRLTPSRRSLDLLLGTKAEVGEQVLDLHRDPVGQPDQSLSAAISRDQPALAVQTEPEQDPAHQADAEQAGDRLQDEDEQGNDGIHSTKSHLRQLAGRNPMLR